MKTFFALFLALFCLMNSSALAQHEYAPLVEKNFDYKNWTLKSIRDDKEVDLRRFAEGKKLVLVVYFAPWCGNWKMQKPFVEKLYNKYKENGLEVIAVSEYGAVEDSQKLIANNEASYQIVVESTTYEEKTKTEHYKYRQQTEDKRSWGSPWNLFFEPSQMRKKGDVLLEKAFVVNGELIEADIEKFVREKLGLPAEEMKKPAVSNSKAEVCAPATKTVSFTKKP